MPVSHALLDRCREAVSLARRFGADAVEAFGQTVEAVNSTVEKNDLQIAKSQFETALGIRAFVGHSVGFASTNDVAQLESACGNAVSLARISPEDPHNVLPEPVGTAPIEGLYDPSAAAFTAADAVRRTADMLSLAESIDPRVTLNDAWFDAGIRNIAIANSAGLAVEERGSLFTYGALATAREGDRVSSFDFQFDATRSVAGIDVEPPIRRACEHALASLGAETGESFRGPVLLSPNAVSEILVGILLFQLNARNALRGRSRWRDAIGEAVAMPSLTLVDDGHLAGGVATATFDREGVPHRRLELIPAIGPTNLSVLPGNASVDELLSGMRQGLFVRRFSGNVDPISGDFSGAAKAAHLVKGGRLERAVSGTLIAGNAFEALKTLSGISERRERVYNLTLPHIRLDNVSVTAR
jgi:PmbA protein